MATAAIQEKLVSFRHGVHPDEHKNATERKPIERMRFVAEYVLPLAQHIGRASQPLVKVGDHVNRGQMIGAAAGFISTALHAPVQGKVVAIEFRPHPSGQLMESIVIKADPYASQRFEPVGAQSCLDERPMSLADRVQEAGIVGLGGAAFPSHVKLKIPDGKKVQFAILNGCECEPFLTCDHRIMLERAEAVVHGLSLIMEETGAERGYIGVEANKADAILALRTYADSSISVIALQVKYPQGAEKMLIDAIFKKEVPSGRLPLDLEMVVNNVGTAVAISDLVRQGIPLMERVVTVTGPGIVRPANVMVPLGTPVQAVIDHCGGLKPDTRQVVLGGPMMGQSQKNLEIPTTKGTSGILVLTNKVEVLREEPCIRCGRCLEACPMFLNPSRLHILARHERPDQLKAYNILDCFECASCSFACPSHIPLVQLLRVGKAIVRQSEATS